MAALSGTSYRAVANLIRPDLRIHHLRPGSGCSVGFLAAEGRLTHQGDQPFWIHGSAIVYGTGFLNLHLYSTCTTRRVD